MYTLSLEVLVNDVFLNLGVYTFAGRYVTIVNNVYQRQLVLLT